MSKNLFKILPIIVSMIFTLSFIFIHFYNNNIAERELNKLLSLGFNNYDYRDYEIVLLEDNTFSVINNWHTRFLKEHPRSKKEDLDPIFPVKQMYYVKGEGNEILKISPNYIKTYKSSLIKRFLNWGITNGDAMTLFRANFWKNIEGKKTNWGVLKLDPTNITFPYLYLVVFLIALFLKKKLS